MSTFLLLGSHFFKIVVTTSAIVAELPEMYKRYVEIIELYECSLETLEQEMTNCSHMILLITPDILDMRQAKFVLHCAIQFKPKIKLIHHAITCKFPYYPDSLKDAFQSKAITYLDGNK